MIRNPFGQTNSRGRCDCAECGRTLGGLDGFDAHRVSVTGQPGRDPEYDRRCATDAEITAKGLRQDARGWWVSPMDAEVLARLQKAHSGRAVKPRAEFKARIDSAPAGTRLALAAEQSDRMARLRGLR